MDNLVSKQLILQGRINNAFKNFKSKSQDLQTKGGARTHMQALNKHYNEFSKILEKITGLENVDYQNAYFTSKVEDSVEDAYYDNHGWFLDFIETYENAEKI